MELGLGKQGQVTPLLAVWFPSQQPFFFVFVLHGRTPCAARPCLRGPPTVLPLARAVQKCSLKQCARGGGRPSTRGLCRAALEASSLQFSDNEDLDDNDRAMYRHIHGQPLGAGEDDVLDGSESEGAWSEDGEGEDWLCNSPAPAAQAGGPLPATINASAGV